MQSKTHTRTSSSDVMKLANETIAACTDNTMEAELLRKKCTRALYKALGDPTPADFPDAFKTAGAWTFTKLPGYTTNMRTFTKQEMEEWNRSPVEYRIERPSKTKQHIIECYVRDGWHVQVQAYNVICTKFVQHPRYPQLAVFFYASRDVARYEYILEKPNAQDD